MEKEDVKEGARVYHQSKPNIIGIITEVFTKYFIINFPKSPSSFDMTPYTAFYEELPGFKLAEGINKKQLEAYTKTIVDRFKVGKSKSDISQEIREKVWEVNDLITQATKLGLNVFVNQGIEAATNKPSSLFVTITETTTY